MSVFAAAVLTVPILRDDPLALWWTIATCLSVGAFLTFSTEPSVAAEPRKGRAAEIALWALSLACALYALICHRPDADDSYYVNVAASVADRPDQTLFATDTLHGLVSLGPLLPVYKVQSWELWNGAFTLLLDISALSAFHFLSTTLVAILAPLAWASLMRRLTPRYWLISVMTVLVVLIAVGDPHRWYGNFAFVRIWQGKALFLTVVLPLVWSYTLRFAERPSWRRSLWLVMSQIAAVGATSSALWAAPAAMGTALVAVVSGRRGWLALAGAGALSGYALLLGVGLKGSMERFSERVADLDLPPGAMLEEAMGSVLGDGAVMVLSCIALAAGWTLAPAGPARRFAAITPAALWLTLLNPYFEQLAAAHLTGPSYWRAMWVLPIPLLLTFLITSPLALVRRRGRASEPGAGGRPLFWALLLGAFVIWVPQIHGWTPANAGLDIGFPRHKVPSEARLARLIARHVPPGAVVVAPRPVNIWIPVLRDHPYPLMVRHYLKMKGYAHRDRWALIRFAQVGQRTQEGVDKFRRGLHRFDVEAVLFYRHQASGDALLRTALIRAGFERAERDTRWELWVRRGETDPKGNPRPDRPLVFPFF